MSCAEGRRRNATVGIIVRLLPQAAELRVHEEKRELSSYCPSATRLAEGTDLLLSVEAAALLAFSASRASNLANSSRAMTSSSSRICQGQRAVSRAPPLSAATVEETSGGPARPSSPRARSA